MQIKKTMHKIQPHPRDQFIHEARVAAEAAREPQALLANGPASFEVLPMSYALSGERHGYVVHPDGGVYRVIFMP